MMNYLKQIAIALEQLVNTLFGGWADETLSSRAYRRYVYALDREKNCMDAVLPRSASKQQSNFLARFLFTRILCRKGIATKIFVYLDKLPCRVIDFVFFWDYEERTWVEDWCGYEPGGTRTVRHCELSYESEKKRLQCAPEFRIENG